MERCSGLSSGFYERIRGSSRKFFERSLNEISAVVIIFITIFAFLVFRWWHQAHISFWWDFWGDVSFSRRLKVLPIVLDSNRDRYVLKPNNSSKPASQIDGEYGNAMGCFLFGRSSRTTPNGFGTGYLGERMLAMVTQKNTKMDNLTAYRIFEASFYWIYLDATEEAKMKDNVWCLCRLIYNKKKFTLETPKLHWKL